MTATTSRAPAQASPRAQLVEAIETNEGKLAAYLPEPAQRRRFVALAVRAVIDNPDLAKCTTASVLRGVGAAAASGLPIDGRMSTLTVRKMRDGSHVAVWDPTYRGMVYLALESGHVASVEAHAVHERDEFRVELGSHPRIVHVPSFAADRGPVVAAYAVATLKAGGQVREVLSTADLARIRDSSPAGDRGPWGSWPDRMAMKSAIRRLLKRLPASEVGTLARAQAAIAEIDDGEGTDYRAELRAPERPAVQPDDTSELEARALEALGSADALEQLETTWRGVRAEFRQARADLPIAVEARYQDRREALS
jgi:recombination protein RecT